MNAPAPDGPLYAELARSGKVRLEWTSEGRVARVVLNRPELRNAFDDELILETTALVEALSADKGVRGIVLAGAGKTFCAGADLNWMKRVVSYSVDDSRRDSERLARLFKALNDSPKPVIGRIHGAALGGGTGLAAVCDVVVAAEGTLFGTTEVRLGIIPAVISPYVVRKIGESNARIWFMTGERWDALVAQRCGLVHKVVAASELDRSVDVVIDELLTGGPEAIAEAKWLARTMGHLSIDEAIPVTVAKIAERRASAEGQEGMKAFLEKRPPSWVPGRPDGGR